MPLVTALRIVNKKRKTAVYDNYLSLLAVFLLFMILTYLPLSLGTSFKRSSDYYLSSSLARSMPSISLPDVLADFQLIELPALLYTIY